MTDSRYATVIAGSIFVIVLLIRAPLLDVPFERDEGEYAYIAWRLDTGELPYLDWFDQKSPAIFWIYRLALALPGSDVVSVHLMAALFAAATAVALFFLTRSLAGTGGGIAAALVLGFLSADPTLQGTAANTELFMLLPSVCAAWLFLRAVRAREPPAWQYLLIGLLTAAASAFKQVAAINCLFFVATAPVLFTGERRAQRTVSLALWSAAGGLLVWGAIAAYFLARGGLGAMIDAVFAHNLQYVGALPLEVQLRGLSSTLRGLFVSQLAVWLLAAVGVCLAWMWQRWIAVFLLGWLIASLIGTSAGGYYFPHYFQQLLPPLAAACGVAVAEVARRTAGRIPAPLLIGILTVVLVAPPAGVLASFWTEPTPEDVVRRVYPGNSFDVMPQVAKVIEEVTEPDDEVFVFGAEPEVLFHARRRSATRYIFLFPLYGPYREAGERQREVIRELLDSRPKAVLWMPNALFFSEGTDQTLTRWVMALMSRRYEPHTLVWLDDEGRRRVVPISETSSTPGLRRQLGAVLVRQPDTSGP